ncbi:hypothetical protein H0H87_006636 [Tephrocybe sp. NHM501043]|nr:hypothetical protein H0H87_006636 [Tephrocybe sp. NHM501043]
MGALEVLQSTSLVEVRDSTFFALPVIQRYILHPSRFLEQVRSSMLETACAFLKEHSSEVGDPLYKAHSAVLSMEDGNLEAVLLTAEVPASHVILDGFLTLARYHWMHRPHVDVVKHGLTLAHSVDDNILQGNLLYCYGDISYRLHQFDNASKQFKEALVKFLSSSDRKRIGDCRLSISYLPGRQFDARKKMIDEARDDYEAANDKVGVGRCLVALGDLRPRHPTTIALLKQAERVLAETKDNRRHAECSLSLMCAYYFSGDYDSSYTSGMSALEQYEGLGYLSQCALTAHDLGRTLSARGDHENSLRYFLRCLEIRKSMGLSPLGATLEGMGLGWIKLGKNMDARRAFEESFQQYSSEDSTRTVTRNGIIRSQFLLKRTEDTDLNPTKEERSALRGRYSDDHIDKILAPL